MFDFIKYRKLRTLLEDGKVIKTRERIDVREVSKLQVKVFDLRSEEGRSNANKFIETLQSKQDAWSRVKMLVVLHNLCVDHLSWSDYIANMPRLQFQGVNLTIKKDTGQNLSLSTVTCIQGKNRSMNNNNLTDPKISIDTSLAVGNNKSVCHTRTVIDEQFNYDDINVYLHLYLVVPYLAYIIKLAVNQDLVDEARNFMNSRISRPDFSMVWKLINTLKGVLPIRAALTNVGRYYLSEHAWIIDFIEALTRDFYNFYGLLEKHISKALICFRELSKVELEHLINILEELNDLNEAMYEVYFNRYYYKLLKHILPPKWINIENEESESIYKHFREKFGMLELTNKKKQDEQVLRDSLLRHSRK